MAAHRIQNPWKKILYIKPTTATIFCSTIYLRFLISSFISFNFMVTSFHRAKKFSIFSRFVIFRFTHPRVFLVCLLLCLVRMKLTLFTILYIDCSFVRFVHRTHATRCCFLFFPYSLRSFIWLMLFSREWFAHPKTLITVLLQNVQNITDTKHTSITYTQSKIRVKTTQCYNLYKCALFSSVCLLLMVVLQFL